VLAALSIAWLAYRMIDVMTDWLQAKAANTDSKLDDQLVPLLRKTLKVFTAVIGVIFALQNLNVDVGSLLAGLGLGGLAFALAARDTIANFFGSLVVFIDKPFQIGDWVVIGKVEGVIEEVGFRTTRVRTFYNSLVTVPNAQLTETAIDNYGARRWRRYVANLGLTYDTPPERVAAFCEGVRRTIQVLPGMRRDYAIVEFNEYGESGLNVMVYCFMDAADWGAELSTRTALNLEMLKLAADLGISFAFPTRTLHLDTQAAPKELGPRKRLDDTQIASVVKRYGTPAERPSVEGSAAEG
jgi:MscS family membrane protein